MLETDCKEVKESKVVIEDFDYETVDAAVSLMYTRKVDYLSVNTLLNLYKFADKYDLLDTKLVFEVLDEKINLNAILEISKFTLANSMDELYQKCVNFFVKDFEKNAETMKGFEDLDSQFAMDIMKKKYRSKTSKNV
uniref:BTB domain-containing protein n=1 Tax=Panagrolaimus sp. JU765 TaxID=591449 RepID=A0AC34RSQ7_9BILA